MVGEQAGVDAAERHILKVVERVDQKEEERRQAVISSGNGSGHHWQPAAIQASGITPPPSSKGPNLDEEKVEDWMAEFDAKNKKPLDMTVLLPNDFGRNGSSVKTDSTATAEAASSTSSAAIGAEESKGELSEQADESTTPVPTPSSAWVDIAKGQNHAWE